VVKIWAIPVAMQNHFKLFGECEQPVPHTRLPGHVRNRNYTKRVKGLTVRQATTIYRAAWSEVRTLHGKDTNGPANATVVFSNMNERQWTGVDVEMEVRKRLVARIDVSTEPESVGIKLPTLNLFVYVGHSTA
jgi:hypothetical protein